MSLPTNSLPLPLSPSHYGKEGRTQGVLRNGGRGSEEGIGPETRSAPADENVEIPQGTHPVTRSSPADESVEITQGTELIIRSSPADKNVEIPLRQYSTNTPRSEGPLLPPLQAWIQAE